MVTIIDLITGDVVEDTAETSAQQKNTVDVSLPFAELQLQIVEQEEHQEMGMPVDLFDADISDFVHQQK